MRSRAARLTVGAIIWVAIGAGVIFVLRTETRISAGRALVHEFDLRARAAIDALADLRASQQAYVAVGQGVEYWMPKVAATLEATTKTLDVLRQTATSAGARAALGEAALAVAEFGSVDTRARDYIRAGEQMMAADVVFTEGEETALAAARQIERARLAEQRMLDGSEEVARRQEAQALGGGATLVAFLVTLLVLAPAPRPVDAGAGPRGASPPVVEPVDLRLREEPIPSPTIPASPTAALGRPPAPLLGIAAELCTELGRVNDLDGLTALLGRAADTMDASGLIVWLGNTTGADLRPAVTHGYSAQAAARMPTVPRLADNAAAAAYRLGQLQIVVSRPGGSQGAVVAPLLSSEGCIGALSAEIRSGGEVSADVQALATIFAAQLAGILTAAPATEQKAAASG